MLPGSWPPPSETGSTWSSSSGFRSLGARPQSSHLLPARSFALRLTAADGRFDEDGDGRFAGACLEQ